MGAIRFPIFVWRDSLGHFGACAVHDPADSAALGPTRSSVIDQVKDYFAYVHRAEHWRRVPEMEEVRLTHVSVTHHQHAKRCAIDVLHSRQIHYELPASARDLFLNRIFEIL